jgi:hypothetical protein
LITKEPLVPGIRKISESKNHWVLVFEKNQVQRTTGSRYFKSFQRTPRFHERTGKDLMVFRRLFEKFQKLRALIICKKCVF